MKEMLQMYTLLFFAISAPAVALAWRIGKLLERKGDRND